MAQGFAPQTRVRVKSTGELGVICPDLQGMLTDTLDGVPVVMDGMGTTQEVSMGDLESLGPEGAVCDDECGIGQGAKCCIFVSFGAPDGFQCQRYGSLRWSLMFRKDKMTSQREPTEPYPNCKLASA